MPRPLPPADFTDLDRELFRFWTETSPDAVEIYDPPKEGPEQRGRKTPQGADPNRRLVLDGHEPQYVSPNYYAKPFDQKQVNCLTNYKTWYTIFETEASATTMLRITGISYHMISYPQWEVFEIQLLKDGAPIAKWEDIQVQVTGNPAEWHGLSGHVRPLPLVVIVDQSSKLSVRARALGPESPLGVFAKTASDLLAPAEMTVNLIGWEASMMRRSQGVPRPVDTGLSLDSFGDILTSMRALRTGQALLDTLERS
jgi:hypothetical protein